MRVTIRPRVVHEAVLTCREAVRAQETTGDYARALDAYSRSAVIYGRHIVAAPSLKVRVGSCRLSGPGRRTPGREPDAFTVKRQQARR